MIRVFDALTGKVNELDPKQPVTMYVCGPTVYDHPHVGNIRPMLSFDVLYRLMRVQGYDVHYVHNITDIDDKIIVRSKELNMNEMELTKIYTKEYLTLMETFSAFIPEIHKVSEEIPDIVDFIQKLIDNGYAYNENGNVYFDVLKDKYYGELSHNDVKNLISGARVDNEPDKHNPLDFALWKKTSEGLNWPTPWCVGRPGWHTECVEMCNKYLGEQITIHGGGIDLKFPHHENENAQNRGISGLKLAKNFMYVGHLTIKGQKMSKSLGNVILAIDMIKTFTPNQVRWFFYQTHYASPIDYNEVVMNDAVNQINRIENSINVFITKFYIQNQRLPEAKLTYNQTFLDALNNDLNFANAVNVILHDVKILNSNLTKENSAELEKVYQNLLGALYVYGISFEFKHTAAILYKISDWQEALKEKDYITADQIREELMDAKVL